MKRFKGKRINRRNSYGIVGAKRGIGTTHLALTLANYLSSKEGYAVIYIEAVRISKLIDCVGDVEIQIGNSAGYRYKGVNYIFTRNIEEIKELVLYSGYTVVVEFESIAGEYKDIFDLCKMKYVIGSMKQWAAKEYIEFIKSNILKKYDAKQILFLAPGINKEEKRKFRNYCDGILRELPFIENPFKVKEKEFVLIDSLLICSCGKETWEG